MPSVNAQTLTNYAKKHKAEMVEKQKIEKEAYLNACSYGTLNAFKNFIKNHPKSKYVRDANSKIRSIELKNEKNAYDKVCLEGTLEAFNGFLKQYPRSKYVPDIKNRIADFDIWVMAKKQNTVQSYNSYLQKSQLKTFAKEANSAIEDIYAVAEWQRIKATNSLSAVQAYISKYPQASSISDARKKEHELKGRDFYDSGNMSDAYREFTAAGGKYSLASENWEAYDKTFEYHEFSILSSYSDESDLTNFLSKYPNGSYSDQVSNWIALSKAKSLTMYSGDYSYKAALAYAKDTSTRNQVKSYYEARKHEYSQYKKQLRKARYRRDGGIINFGIECLDIAFNPSAYDEDDVDSDIDYVMYCNVGVGIKLGNFKSPVQFEVGAKPGFVLYTLWYGSDDETKAAFHLPLYARLKINIFKGNYTRWYIDGIGYYNAVKESYLESDYSASAGLGVAWRHWDWRCLYYKQDIAPKETYSNYKFLGTSFSYYF